MLNKVGAKEKSGIVVYIIFIYVVPILTFTIYFSVKNIATGDLDLINYPVNHSSVWCKSGVTDLKLCTFTNVCYDPDLMSFLFFFGNLTVIKGFTNYDEFQAIQLSSVRSHNKFFANMSIININDYVMKPGKVIGKGLLFSRFKPDNIMHVIHDDLIPLFLTLEEICLGNLASCLNVYTLIIHDNHPKSSFFMLYEYFSNRMPIILSQLPQNSSALCFQELHVGLVRDSIFYQYGFKELQGPVENIKLSSNDLVRFNTFMYKNLNIKAKHKNKTDIILVSRKKSRRILNVGEVIHMLKKVFGIYNPLQKVEITTLDLYETKIEIFIEKVAQASALVGMHGAEMIFSIFLKPNSTVVELFPFAVQPDVVSFIRPLTKLDGIHFQYIPWKNKHKNNSAFHPEADSLHGGIHLLHKDLQQKIMNIEVLPAVECCDNPMYLYYMYQDTWVNSDFEQFLLKSLVNNVNVRRRVSELQKWLFPSPVTDFVCIYNSVLTQLNISWKAPFNVRAEVLNYDLFLMEDDSKFSKNIVTENTHLTLKLPSNKVFRKFQVWITALLKRTGTKSNDVLFECI